MDEIMDIMMKKHLGELQCKQRDEIVILLKSMGVTSTVKVVYQAKGFPLQTSFQRILEAASQGMEDTKLMITKTGRSKTYEEKTFRHLDSGSIITY